MKKKITIIGLGLIGGSLGMALRQAGFKGILAGVSSSRTLEAARCLGFLDETYTYEELGESVRRSNYIFLCSPIYQIAVQLKLLRAHTTLMAPGCIISDAGSTKSFIMSQAGGFGPRVHFIGGHPMAGSEKRGVQAADPYLFQNAIYVLTPAAGVPGGAVKRLAGRLAGIGAKIVVLDAASHDRIAAAISHLPQLLAVALVNLIGRYQARDPHYLQLAAGGFRDMTRIASSPFFIWEDILSTNQKGIISAVKDLVREISVIQGQVGKKAIEKKFTRAAEIRGKIPASGKGFIHLLTDILVQVEDKPGVLAEMTGILARHKININDIEVMKVRVGEGGTIRLGFTTKELAEKAVKVLKKNKIQARVKE
jgi:prephenate dehydrogenase